MVSFECDNSNIMEELSGLGKLIEKVVSIDYSCKLKPLLSMCGKEMGKNRFVTLMVSVLITLMGIYT